MPQLDLEKTLQRIKENQWSLADFDWEAPGAEKIPEEQWHKLKAFMADLTWIEHIGARGFAAMAKKAPNDTLKQIYEWFHAEEQRHANAELALMRRWGMIKDDELPEPNINLRITIEWLDKFSDDMPLNVLGSVIPMLEVTLDGALCKFLLEEVKDPMCHEVFAKINADEARHLGVDFHVLEMLGHGPKYRIALETLATAINPKLMLGVMAYFPLLNRMRDNIVKMGLKEERLYEAMAKFKKYGGSTPEGRANPWYQLMVMHGGWVIDRKNKLYHTPVDAMVKLADKIPAWILPDVPTWVNKLTWRPFA